MKRFIKIFIAILVVLVIVIAPAIYNIADAGTKAKTLAELRKELSSLKSQQSSNEQSKTNANNKISSDQTSIANKRSEIEANQTKISNAISESNKLTQEIEDGKGELKKLVKVYQLLDDSTSYIEYIFESSSYEELIYRYAVVDQILEYEKKQINSWNEKIDYNTQLKKDLQTREVTLNSQIDSLESDIDALGDTIDDLNDEALDIKTEITATEKLIKYYVGLGCGENEDLDECVKVKGDTTFRRPLVKGTITSNYGYRTSPTTGASNQFHSGTDIGVSEGSKVYSIANGTVGYIVRKSSCGGNKVYIFHTVNGKKYTSTYMHLLSINVSVGQKVTQNTVIGLSGGRSTGTNHGGYDRCTTGAHLHLSISSGGWYTVYSTWKAHLVNPRNVVDLPKTWSSR